MAIFAQSNFPGAANASIIGTAATIGGNWSLITPDGDIAQDGTGGIFQKQFGSVINDVITLPAVPPSANYYTQFVANYISGNFQIGTVSRVVDGSNYWTCNVSISQITLNWVIANVDQPGGIVYAYDMTAVGKNRPTVAVFHNGNDHYLLVNGVVVGSILGQAAFPLAGTVGVISRGNNCAAGTGMHLESFIAYTVTLRPPPPSYIVDRDHQEHEAHQRRTKTSHGGDEYVVGPPPPLANNGGTIVCPWVK